jgi:pSer/pThr/pTyr-binding forkhead associated (FHA) protein
LSTDARDAPLPRNTPAFACRLVGEGREIDLAEGENVVGRDAGCSIRVDSARVSRHHARILVTGRTARVEDLGSKSGTFL